MQQSLRMGGYHAYGIHPDRLFGVGALAPRGLSSFIGGLCGDHSPHRTTMTQTKRCPIFKFGSWWCFSRQSPQESDCEINASFAQGCGCVINASRRCGVPATGCCGTGPCLDQSSYGITEPQGQAGLEGIIPPTVHLVLLAVFMEVSPIFTIWLAVLRVSSWWSVWYFEAAWWRCRVCIEYIISLNVV